MSRALESVNVPGSRRILLYVRGRRRRPRVLHRALEAWARSWARRWWVVEAPDAAAARAAIAAYDKECARVGLSKAVRASRFGIIEAVHNAPGGPDHPQLCRFLSRPAPAAVVRRRANARGPTAEATRAR